jgi:beta-lactamase superfamily II metal-dependent hydrolase
MADAGPTPGGGDVPFDGLAVDMLPARQGDCLLLRWWDGRRTRRMLVDAGPSPAYSGISRRLARLDGDLDVVVVSHIDADHIDGVILLLNDRELGLDVGDVWYNGSAQLTTELGAVQGEILGTIIAGRRISWNRCFGSRPIVVRDDPEGFPVRELPGGLQVTVLGPDMNSLRRLRDAWSQTCHEAGIDVGSVADALAALDTRPRLRPGDSYLAGEPVPDVRKLARGRKGTDTSVPNGSSVVLLVERGSERLLLAGDATPGVLAPAVRKLLATRGVQTLPLTVFKLPHHGSAKNITAELVRMLPAQRYLISTDGSFFNHPDDAAVATVLEYGPPGLELVFSYDSPRNRRWDDPRLRECYGHRVTFAAETGPDEETPRP